VSQRARVSLALFLCFQGLFGLTASGRVDRIADEFEVYLQVEWSDLVQAVQAVELQGEP